MKPNKNDVINELSSDYVLNAGNVLAVHISFVFSSRSSMVQSLIYS